MANHKKQDTSLPTAPKRRPPKRRKADLDEVTPSRRPSDWKVSALPRVGAEIERVKKLRQQFDADQKRLSDGAPTPELLAPAVGYFIGYPLFLEWIGHEWRKESTRKAAYYALNHVHMEATKLLMIAAEQFGLDSAPLWEFGRVCREIFADEPWKLYTGQHDTWPECLGQARLTLPEDYRIAIRDGETTLHRLNAKLSIDAEAVSRTMGPRGSTPGQREQSDTSDSAAQADAPSVTTHERPLETKPDARPHYAVTLRPNDETSQDLMIFPAERVAKWKGATLRINSNADFQILHTLAQDAGQLVAYKALLLAIKPGDVSQSVSVRRAPPAVKDAVKHITAAFNTVDCTWIIENVVKQGYRLNRSDLANT